MDWLTLLPIVIAVCGFFFGLFKWFHHWAAEKHRSHERKFEDHARKIEENEKVLSDTRDELLRDYVRVDHLERMENKLTHAIEAIHIRLGGIAKDLNQAIGRIEANQEEEMHNIARQVKQALQDKTND